MIHCFPIMMKNVLYMFEREEEIESGKCIVCKCIVLFCDRKNDRVFHKIKICGMPLFLCGNERRSAIYEK